MCMYRYGTPIASATVPVLMNLMYSVYYFEILYDALGCIIYTSSFITDDGKWINLH